MRRYRQPMTNTYAFVLLGNLGHDVNSEHFPCIAPVFVIIGSVDVRNYLLKLTCLCVLLRMFNECWFMIFSSAWAGFRSKHPQNGMRRASCDVICTFTWLKRSKKEEKGHYFMEIRKKGIRRVPIVMHNANGGVCKPVLALTLKSLTTCFSHHVFLNQELLLSCRSLHTIWIKRQLDMTLWPNFFPRRNSPNFMLRSNLRYEDGRSGIFASSSLVLFGK